MTKRTIEIRTRISVEVGSPEEILWDYLRNKKATPYPFHQMLTMAITPFWLALAYQYNKFSKDLVAQSLSDAAYSWQLHQSYLHKTTDHPRNPIVDDDTSLQPLKLLRDSPPVRSLKPDKVMNSTDSQDSADTSTGTSATTYSLENSTTSPQSGATQPFNIFGQSIISKQSN